MPIWQQFVANDVEKKLNVQRKRIKVGFNGFVAFQDLHKDRLG
jgi:hypothetical protein